MNVIGSRMKVKVGVAHASCAALIVSLGLATTSAGALYTNTWVNTEGAGVVKDWGDAANWTVAYGSGTPAPADAVPTDRRQLCKDAA